MKSDKEPVKITVDSNNLPDDELNKVAGGSGGKTWTRYWCNYCNAPHILDDPNNTCPLSGEVLQPWDNN